MFFDIKLSFFDKKVLTNENVFAIMEKNGYERTDYIMYSKSFTHYAAKVVVDILLYLALVSVIALPFLAEKVFFWIDYADSSYFKAFSAIVFLSGLGCVYILYHLKMMYKTLLVGNPFIEANIIHLRKIAVACCVISVLFIVKCAFLFTLAAAVIAFVFLVGCLFCLTLKDLFKQAVNYKTENELTI